LKMAMKPVETFPLDWEQLLWSSSPAFPLAASSPGVAYGLTDFRLVVRRRRRTVRELALDDIESVSLTQSWWQKALGISTVRVKPRRKDLPSLDLANISHGPQLALILQLRATELFGDDTTSIDAEFFRSALGPQSPSLLRPHQGLALAATIAFALVFGVIAVARHSSLPPVVYSPDDPIAPAGRRRSTEDIAAFMQRDVMPFAQRALAPLVGGAEKVSCLTCHGPDAEQRNWKMPGVRALPEPELRLAGLERAKSWLDPQMRNAVYGYLAEEQNQYIATYMRQVVMPGMARLMKRPAYDFAKSYGYNRVRAAVGCYHCHLVE
jgi:cytochrome c553